VNAVAVVPAEGIDHGVWIPMRIAWPDGSIPMVQVSLPEMPPDDLVRMGAALRPLREKGVLVLGSGGMMHNLMQLRRRRPARNDLRGLPSRKPGNAEPRVPRNVKAAQTQEESTT